MSASFPRPLRVLHEDDRFLALDKPSGQPSIRERNPAEDLSIHTQAQERSGEKLFVVHRLDRETSGVILFAKTAPAHRELSLLFESRRVEKTYWALISGHLKGAHGKVEAPLREFGSGRSAVDPRGKPSSTRWRVLEKLPVNDLVEAKPLTGRRHQIRVHLYSLGHPVLGDPLYGRDRPVGGVSRLMLHALALVLPVPGTAPLHLRAEPPPDFMEALEQQRRTV